MSPLYPWILFLHIAAALWLGAGVFASSVIRAQGRRAQAVPERAMAAKLLWRLHAIYTIPGLLLGGFLGFYLVSIGGFRFGETWVLAASFLYLLLFLSTLFVVTPGLARQRAAASRATAPDATPEAVAALLEKVPGIASDVNGLLLLLLVSLMAIKP
jgi:uncharacterized membrane protein